MMSDEKFPKTRYVLGDLTNRIGKRGFSFVKSEDGFIETTSNKDKAPISSDNSDKKKCLTKRVLISCNEINTSGRKVISGKLTSTSASSISVTPSPVKEHSVNADSTKSGPVEFLGFLDSEESRASGVERRVGGTGVPCANSSAGIGLIKSCECSFCSKAAYIWSDLHYQDIKGRIDALKKSQQAASVLVLSSSRDKGIEKHGQGTSRKFSKLESDLTGQWRSLFRCMEDIFGREISHLESSLGTLKDVRENCKTELNGNNGVPSEKQ